VLDKSVHSTCREAIDLPRTPIYRGASEARRSHNTMHPSFSAQALTRKPLPLLPFNEACTEPLALSDSEWGSEPVEICPERSDWKERPGKQAALKTSEGGGEFFEKRCRAPARLALTREGSEVINLFQNETYLKHISLTQPLEWD
jgi:hypothetical protein